MTQIKEQTSEPFLQSAQSAKSAVPFAFLGWCFLAYVMLIAIGVIVFRTPGTMVRGNEMSRDRAIFTVLNAVTLTGFQQTTSVGDYRWPGQAMVLVLIVGGSLFTMIAGGVAVARIAGLP